MALSFGTLCFILPFYFLDQIEGSYLSRYFYNALPAYNYNYAYNYGAALPSYAYQQYDTYDPSYRSENYIGKSKTSNKVHDIHINMNKPSYENTISESREKPEAKSSGYQKPKTKFVPVVVQRKKKKQKVISVNKGSFIPGGVQVFGKFKSLKSCMKACGATPTCFAGDYNPWTGKCYFHSNFTACDDMASHSKITHFKKIPCIVTDAPRGKIILGTQLFGAIEQKGIKDLPSCLKKCAGLGSGISPSPTTIANTALFGNRQLCFGINYDFASHKCYFLVNNFPRIGDDDDARENYALCPIVDNQNIRTPIDLRPNPTTITVLLCPTRTG